MDIFSIISLLGGLALFLYGMKLMSGTLKECSSGTLKVAMEKVTNNPVKAFLLGVLITAIIQSSTATIVITSGLVAAGLISLDQSLGIIIGANVGTTVTGQIIRLLGINADGNSILRLFQPSTLAPVALIVGIVFIMFMKFRMSDVVGNILVGFGVLFTGLLNMTAAVSAISQGGLLDRLLAGLGDNPVLGYATGAGVAFVLQSSSATIGILQAFALSSTIPFKTIYIVIVGIYLGDCLTTAIVCSIGAKADAKRVGLVNILFNLSETVLVLIAVTIFHVTGLIDGLWEQAMTPGSIANTNSIFNLACSILLLPMVGVYGKLSRRFIKDEENASGRYAEKIESLNPVFFATPALAFRSCYHILIDMFDASRRIIDRSFSLLAQYDENVFNEVIGEENDVDMLADKVSNYMVALSPYVREDYHVRILDEYYKIVTEFERLGDHGTNMSEIAADMSRSGASFSTNALEELAVTKELLDRTLDSARLAFVSRDEKEARHIEPLEQVMDDVIEVLHDEHLERLRSGKCSVHAGTRFLDVLSNLERISDICSNVGVATISRIHSDPSEQGHSYIASLHEGRDANFNKDYEAVKKDILGKLDELG